MVGTVPARSVRSDGRGRRIDRYRLGDGLEAEHQAIVQDVLAAGDFWGGAGSAGNNMADTDASVGSSWA